MGGKFSKTSLIKLIRGRAIQLAGLWCIRNMGHIWVQTDRLHVTSIWSWLENILIILFSKGHGCENLIFKSAVQCYLLASMLLIHVAFSLTFALQIALDLSPLSRLFRILLAFPISCTWTESADFLVGRGEGGWARFHPFSQDCSGARNESSEIQVWCSQIASRRFLPVPCLICRSLYGGVISLKPSGIHPLKSPIVQLKWMDT